MDLKLFPLPSKFNFLSGTYTIPLNFIMYFDYKNNKQIYDIIDIFTEQYKTEIGGILYPLPDHIGKLYPEVLLCFKEGLRHEEYHIQVCADKVVLSYSDVSGAFYALQSFLQLLKNYKGKIPCMSIIDYPCIKNRGFLLDISRGRVPKSDTIFKIIDILAELKYNQLQLYMEAPVAELSEFPEYATETEALTPFEIMRISDYCKKRCITLIPNHNSFGHIHVWMRKYELRELSALPNGYALNPTNPNSIKFLERIYDSLLPCFDSDTFNVGCDEVSELNCEGSRTKEICDADKSIVPLYLKHVNNIYSLLSERGKKMMMWADIITNHPETIDKLPKDIIPMVWGYGECMDFMGKDKLLSDAGLHFYNCSGTSSWACVFADNDIARQNIYIAVEACMKYGGEGVILTDWGDAGHCQPFLLSYISIAYNASLCWNYNINDYELSKRYVDNNIFCMQNDSLSDVMFKAGCLAPKDGNCTPSFLSLLLDIDDFSVMKMSEEDLISAQQKIVEYSRQVSCMRMNCSDNLLYIDEFVSSSEVYSLLIDLQLLKYELRDKGFINDFENKIRVIEKHIRDAKIHYRKVWAQRYCINGWYGFWWFVDRQILKFKDFYYKQDFTKSRKSWNEWRFEEPDDDIK